MSTAYCEGCNNERTVEKHKELERKSRRHRKCRKLSIQHYKQPTAGVVMRKDSSLGSKQDLTPHKSMGVAEYQQVFASRASAG